MSERRKKCLEVIEKSGFDGVLFAVGPNFQYLSESHSLLWQRNCFNTNAAIAGASIIPEALIFNTHITFILKEHLRFTAEDHAWF